MADFFLYCLRFPLTLHSIIHNIIYKDMDLILKYFPNLSELQRTQFAKLKELY